MLVPVATAGWGIAGLNAATAEDPRSAHAAAWETAWMQQASFHVADVPDQVGVRRRLLRLSADVGAAPSWVPVLGAVAILGVLLAVVVVLSQTGADDPSGRTPGTVAPEPSAPAAK